MKPMMRDRRIRAVWIPLLVGAFAAGCASLNYDEPPSQALPTVQETAATDGTETSEASGAEKTAAETTKSTRARRETPTRARISQRDPDAPVEETARSWRELAQLARESAQTGKFDRADELLAQAALQLKDRPPTHTPRRTVFGLRARLALDLASFGEVEKADVLTDTLLDEVRAEPELADAALVALARATAARRGAAAKEAGREESQLPLLALAFDASQAGTASRERLELSFEVSGLALRSGELELSRRAIDQTLLDAQIIAPSDRMQTAALKIYKARIALAQRELDTAEAAAHAAVRIFEQQEADASNRGVAEATLGQILAEKGELERALELGRGAYARLSGEEKLVPHAQRQIPACLARIEWLAGEREAAGSHYREALSVPADGSDRDAELIHDIKSALTELETSAPPAATP